MSASVFEAFFFFEVVAAIGVAEEGVWGGGVEGLVAIMAEAIGV